MLGSTLVIKTDQQSVKYLLEQRLSATSQHPRLDKLMGDYKMKYKGKENSGVDALPAIPSIVVYMMALTAISTDLYQLIQHRF